MKILDLRIGSDEWKEARRHYCVASEAPGIMNASKHFTREELLRMKSSGDEKEVTKWQQIIFDRGHEKEAEARPIAEDRGDEPLFEVAGVSEVDGVQFFSSFDGLNMDESDHWEHKQFNKELYERLSSGGELGPEHYWQLEHQMLTRGGDSCRFAVSDGTEENYLEIRYHSVPERRAQLIQGWKIFMEELEGYEAEYIAAKPEGKTFEPLPALNVQVTGKVLASNLDKFAAVAKARADAIKTELVTDEDFADAENAVKFCEDVEDKLKHAKSVVLGQAEDVNQVMQTLDFLTEEFRKKRISCKNQIDSEKQKRRAEIVSANREVFNSYIEGINKTLEFTRMPPIAIDIAGQIKGKRNFQKIHDAAKGEVARAKGEANIIADKLRASEAIFNEMAGDHMHLFLDAAELALKDPADLKLNIQARIDEEEKRLAAKEAEAAEAKTEPEKPVNAGGGFTFGAPAKARVTASPGKTVPTDDEIIRVLMSAFSVDRLSVVNWLQGMNLQAEKEKLAS